MLKMIFAKLDLESIWKQTLSYDNKYSNKRVTKLFIVVCLMVLTFWDFCAHDHNLRIEIFLAWLSLVGYDGYRITKEKQIDKQQTLENK